MSISDIIKKLNQNTVFKFISSIRLAVPLMISLGVIVAYGTFIESNYNAEYASMAIYKSNWFGSLIILLWINIFSATLSRIPFKLHHTGFVITHIGLLTLLIGGYVTNRQGVDGQLVIPEGQSSSTVTLPHLMVGFHLDGMPTPQTIKFEKSIFEKSQDQLDDINEVSGHLFKVKKYIPFAKVEKGFAENQNETESNVAVSFMLKSNFFNVSEWLHSNENPILKMGPATLIIEKVDSLEQRPFLVAAKTKSSIKKVKKSKKLHSSKSSTNDAYLTITNRSNPKDLKKIGIADFQNGSVQFKNINIKLKNIYSRAVVAENKVSESPDPSVQNPAVELIIEKEGQTLREILYAKYEGFSLNNDGVFGYSFAYFSDSASLKSDASEMSENNYSDEQSPHETKSFDNKIIFSVDPKVASKARVTLIKNDKIVMSEILDEGQNLQTPWMGMTLFLGSVRKNTTQQNTARSINAEKFAQLPPSALLISTSDRPNEEFWLTEGEEKQVLLSGKKASIFFGRQTIELPFDLKLEKFSKIDYPGTNTPLSFESLVQIGQTGLTEKISMNEPMKSEGYTIYQASYSIEPGQTLSVFSVNKDPGREIKYLGSIILGIGIILITLMRSRFWKNLVQRKFKNA